MLRNFCASLILFLIPTITHADTIPDDEVREIIRRELDPSNQTIDYRNKKITLHKLVSGYDFSPFLSKIYRTLDDYNKNNQENVFHIIYDKNASKNYNENKYLDTLGIKSPENTKCFYRKYTKGKKPNFDVASIFIDNELNEYETTTCVRKYFLLLNGRNYCPSCEKSSNDDLFEQHLKLLEIINRCKSEKISAKKCYLGFKKSNSNE